MGKLTFRWYAIFHNRRFPERHTAENIVDSYEQVVVDYGLQGKVSLLVTDSAANMLKAFRVAFGVPAVSPEDEDGDEELEEVWLVRLES